MNVILANGDIRSAAKKAKVRLWEIALRLEVCELTLSRKLRTELSAPEKGKLLDLIQEIAAEREIANGGATNESETQV